MIHRKVIGTQLAAALIVLAVTGSHDSTAGPVAATPSAAFSGNQGLRVTVDGEACADQNHETVTGSVGGSQTVQACETVDVQSAVVNTGGSLEILAGHQISFSPGFTVQAGATIAASVETARVRGGFVRDDTPAGERHYAVRFWFRPDSLTLGADERLILFEATDLTGRAWVVLRLRYDESSNSKRLFLEAAENSGFQSTEGAGEIAPGAGWHALELEWVAAGPGSANGSLSIELDGAAQTGLSGLDNGNGRIDSIRWGLLNAIPSTDGFLDLDEFVSRRAGRIGLAP